MFKSKEARLQEEFRRQLKVEYERGYNHGIAHEKAEMDSKKRFEERKRGRTDVMDIPRIGPRLKIEVVGDGRDILLSHGCVTNPFLWNRLQVHSTVYWGPDDTDQEYQK